MRSQRSKRLQRIVHGGGRPTERASGGAASEDAREEIEREYGLGRGALDLLVLWREKRHAIEVKLCRDAETEEDALDQVARYPDHAGLDAGWLVIFDLRKEPTWDEKLFAREVCRGAKTIRIVNC